MGFNIKHINKYWHWVKNQSKNYRQDCKVANKYARLNLHLSIAQLLNKQTMIDKAASKKHEWVLDYMEKRCSETIEKYRNMPVPENLKDMQTEKKVWSMWWQGEEQADKLFRMCINSARRHTKMPVITLSKDNYKDYFEIPDYILKKHAEGKVMIQHICDLMVVSIMAAEGGFFTGATVWWSQDATDDVLLAPYYTCRAVTDSKYNMSRSRWVGYLMGGNKEFPLFSFTRDCLLEYWKKEDKAVDYLMMDYIFELAYRNIPCVKEMIDDLPEKNNLLRNELIEKLSEPYDEKRFKRYTEGDTFLYKLSWKFGGKAEETVDGKPTNYAHMLAECGDRI